MRLFSIATFTLLSAIGCAGVAGVFSVFGMLTLFSGIPAVGISAGVVSEFAKIMAVSWLYRYGKTANKILVFVGALLTICAMTVTSIGVFGMLSKAHTEQGASVSTSVAQLEVIEQRIAREQKIIVNDQKVLDQLDSQVQALIDAKKVSMKGGARDLRLQQKQERAELDKEIKETQQRIDQLQEEKFKIGQTVRNFEVELGPIKYVAEMLHTDNIDGAIRIVIILILLTLDPMAIFLLICYNHIVLNKEKSVIENVINKSIEADTSDVIVGINNEPLVEVDTPEQVVNMPVKEDPKQTPKKSNIRKWFF